MVSAQQRLEALTSVEALYRRLEQSGEEEVAKIWDEWLLVEEELGPDPGGQGWMEFWKGRQSCLQGKDCHNIFIALADHYAEGHPISLAAAQWLANRAPPWKGFRLRHRPSQPQCWPHQLPLARQRDEPRWESLQFQAQDQQIYLPPNRVWDRRSGRPLSQASGLSQRGSLETPDPYLSREGRIQCTIDRLNRSRLEICVEGKSTCLELGYQVRDLKISQNGHWILCLAQFSGSGALCYDLRGFELDSQGRILRTSLQPGIPWGQVWHRWQRWSLKLDSEFLVLFETLKDGTEKPLLHLPPWYSIHRFSAEDRYARLHIDGQHPKILDLESGKLEWDQKNFAGARFPSNYSHVRAICADSLRCYLELPEENNQDYEGVRWGRPAVRDLLSGKDLLLQQPRAKPLCEARFLPGNQLLVFSQDGDYTEACPVRLWDLNCEPPKQQARFSFPPLVSLPAVSENGEWLAAATSYDAVWLYRLQPGGLPKLSGHQSTIRHLCLSQDGRILASGSNDQTVGVFDLEEGRPLAQFGEAVGWTCPQVSAEGRWVLVRSSAPDLLYDLEERQLFEGQLRLSRDGKVARAEKDRIDILQPETWEVLVSYEAHQAPITSFAFSPFHPWMVSGDEQGGLHVWSVVDGKTFYRQQEEGFPIQSIAWVSPSKIRYFPKNKIGNYHWTWTLGAGLSGGWDPSPVIPYESSSQGRCPSGIWEFWCRGTHLNLLHLSTGRRFYWPCTTRVCCGLFRNSQEILIGLDSGDILHLDLPQMEHSEDHPQRSSLEVPIPSRMARSPWESLRKLNHVLVVAPVDSGKLLPFLPLLQQLQSPDLKFTLAIPGHCPDYRWGWPLENESEAPDPLTGYLFSRLQGHAFWVYHEGAPPVLAKSYAAMEEALQPEALVLLDSGGDSLIVGDEETGPRPARFLSHLCAIPSRYGRESLLLVSGLGLGPPQPYCLYYQLQALAELSRERALLDGRSLLPQQPASLWLKDLLRGQEHLLDPWSQAFLQSLQEDLAPLKVSHPLSLLQWTLDLDRLTSGKTLLKWIREAQSLTEVERSLENFRHSSTPRPWRALPH